MLPFRYARPGSVAEALQLRQDHPDSRYLAGGTDLTVGLRDGKVRPDLLIDIKRLDDLAPGITETDDGGLHISATTRMTEVGAHPRVRAHYPALVEAANIVGSIQIRNRATIAGNSCTASPAADTVPPLSVYGASVVMQGPAGRRELELVDYITGPRRTELAADEMVVGMRLPAPRHPRGSAFARLTRRRGVDLATINLACSASEDGEVVFAYGAVAPRPLLVRDTSGTLIDPESSPSAKDAVLAEMAAHASPITDVRATAEYRAAMLLVLSRRALASATTRLRESPQ
ncbi:xanthine dehydrogenase family protein subunit M [Streptomyces sp. NP160]|uniref:FAD binding domain-containing protein n=1 Tax=Streptomyces sp. NP160 TaxID=2586637 RepID=UPI00111B7E31|nr:xanthine dehydrogenase family protein subunit M [Streptomyces sp. NP160]TNM63177.1 xanthine dehydrogenase family protein subunit M [Streptomyces sp. NP160]